MKEENNENLPEWFSLIQTSQKDYIHIWEKFSKRKSKIRWNWAAFLFGPFWLLYRKIYYLGIPSVLLTFKPIFVTGLLFHLLRFDPNEIIISNENMNFLDSCLLIPYLSLFPTVSLIHGLLAIPLGLFGNQIYFWNLERLYKKGIRSSFYRDTGDKIFIIYFLTVFFLIIIAFIRAIIIS